MKPLFHSISLIAVLILSITTGCGGSEQIKPDEARESVCEPLYIPGSGGQNEGNPAEVREALLSTRFDSYEILREVVDIVFPHQEAGEINGSKKPAEVRLSLCSSGSEITSILREGTSEKDISKASEGGIGKRLALLGKNPFPIRHRTELKQIYLLGRRRPIIFGEGDPAFFDLAEATVCNIDDFDLFRIPASDLTEKGYLNTFNHITAQAMITTLFSEEIADFIADAHERAHMPELITGNFTREQIEDLETGPVDNYVDMINNEWGQEIGKDLREKYHIRKGQDWTPELLASYLNDLQSYYSWAFGIGFQPFRSDHQLIIRFSSKMNDVRDNLSDYF